jgi:hypothetical protein
MGAVAACVCVRRVPATARLRRAKPARTTGSARGASAGPGLVFACFLEGFLHPKILFSATDVPGGGLVLGHTTGPGALQGGGTGPEATSWLQAANALKFRGLEGSALRQASAGKAASSPPPGRAPSHSSRSSSLALQLRVPDYEVLPVNRSTRPDTYCLGGSIKCNPAKHLVVPRERLFLFIADEKRLIDGHPSIAHRPPHRHARTYAHARTPDTNTRNQTRRAHTPHTKTQS